MRTRVLVCALLGCPPERSIPRVFGPGTEVRVDASNSFAARPQIRFEYAVARKVGAYTSIGCFFTEFDTVIETPVGRFENEWDASSFNIFVGAMLYPFR